MKLIEGGCLCHAVRYTATAEPLTVRACWCRVCQYFAAGNASVNLAFERSTVTLTGELRDLPLVADSGNHMHRRSCRLVFGPEVLAQRLAAPDVRALASAVDARMALIGPNSLSS